MRRFYANFRDRQSTRDRPDSGLRYTPSRWSAMKVGGPDTCEIALSGPTDSLHEALRLLGDRVRIYDENGAVRWFGYVAEIEINYGATVVSVSLESVANRIAVVYTAARADGTSERRTTAWAEDSDSIARFGIKERRPSFEGTDEEAEAFRDAELLRSAWPVPVVRSTGGMVMAGGTGVLFCQGPWHRLSWQYWANLAGLEEYTDDGPGEVTIGGSYTTNTIAFGAPDDMTDSLSGLGSLAEGDGIYIAGAANPENNGEFTIKTEGAAAIEISENTFVSEAAGATITVSRNHARVDKVAQSFTLSHNTDPWLVSMIAIRAQKAGSPTGNITLELCADSGGNPGTVLETSEVLGSTLQEDMGWVEFTMAATTQLSFGITYWLVVSKATQTLANYYIVDLNEDAGYAAGACRTHNGSFWQIRSPAADMPFRVVGSQGSLGQVRDIVEANAEFGADSVVIVDTSNIKTEQYREGDGLASDEVEDLIALGRQTLPGQAGESLIVSLTENRRVIIEAQPAGSGAYVYRYRRDGQIEVGNGATLAAGQTIAGQWVQPDDLPILDIFKAATALFVETSEYDAQSDRLNFVTDGALSVYKGRRVQRG